MYNLYLILMKDLIKAFDNQKIIKINERDTYLINTLTDHIPSTTPLIMKQVINGVIDSLGTDLNRINKIVGEEERGGYIAACLALAVDLPFCLAKQNPCKIPGEKGVKFSISYNKNMSLYFNGLLGNDRVVIVDDIIDSGKTMTAMIKTLQQMNVKIIRAIAIAERVEKEGLNKIKEETGIEVNTLLKINTSGRRSVVVNKSSFSNENIYHKNRF